MYRRNQKVNLTRTISPDYSPAIHYLLLISFQPNLRLFLQDQAHILESLTYDIG